MNSAHRASRRSPAAALPLLSALLAFGCFGTKTAILPDDLGTDADADADADSDSDSDSDSDADGDTDTETGGGCGGADQECCEVEPMCAEGTLPVALGGPNDCVCLLSCAPALCDDEAGVWEADLVACVDVSAGEGIGACFADEDMLPIDSGCEDTTAPCTTESGYTDGFCLSDGANLYCMRLCVPDNDVCDLAHTCVLLSGADGEYIGGACVPNS